MKKCCLVMLFLFSALSCFAKEYKNIAFNWTLVHSAINGIEIINMFMDNKKIEKQDNLITYWVKFENQGNTTIAHYAIDCVMRKRALMGGIQYDKNNNTI